MGAMLRQETGGRPAVITFRDEGKEDGEVFKLDKEVEREDLGDTPRITITFTAPPKVFSASAILNERGKVKKFSKVVEGGADYELRLPQQEALLKMQRIMEPAKSESFMTILPTGCGKTAIIALAPFVMEASRVLIIAPGLTIASQIVEELAHFYSNDHPVGREAQISATSDLYSSDKARLTTNKSSIHKADVVATNIQALMRSKKTADGEKVFEVSPGGEKLLNGGEKKFDLIIIDEGHHMPATSWSVVKQALIDMAEKADTCCKFILLTATPARGDGQYFNLTKAQVRRNEMNE